MQLWRSWKLQRRRRQKKLKLTNLLEGRGADKPTPVAAPKEACSPTSSDDEADDDGGTLPLPPVSK
jgi:hypothetical protein